MSFKFGGGNEKTSSYSEGDGWFNNADTSQLNKANRSGSSEAPWGPQSFQVDNLFDRAQYMMDNASGLSDREQYVYGEAADRARELAGGLMSDLGIGSGRSYGGQGGGGNFANVMNQVEGRGPSELLSDATMWGENNPYLESAIEQSWKNAQKYLDRNVGGAGGLNAAAAGTGNMASSRAGVAEGLARAEMADAGQQNELAARQAAFSQGLGASLDQLGLIAQQGSAAAGLDSTLASNATRRAIADQEAKLSGAALINELMGSAAGYAGGMEGGSMSNAALWDALARGSDIIQARDWGGDTTSYDDASVSGIDRSWGESKETGYSRGNSSMSGQGFSFDLDDVAKALILTGGGGGR